MKKIILSIAIFASIGSIQAENFNSKSTIKIEDDCLVCGQVGANTVCGYGSNCGAAMSAFFRATR
jgi:hypothetical protein